MKIIVLVCIILWGAHHGEEFNKVNTKIHDITPKHFLTRTSIGKLCVKKMDIN